MSDDNSELKDEFPEVPVTDKEEITIKEDAPQPKRKPGRPKEAKDKKPRFKRKVVIKEEPIEIEELPRAINDSLPIPSEPTTDKYALMLKLLQDQAQTRKNKKAELWKSWFVR